MTPGSVEDLFCNITVFEFMQLRHFSPGMASNALERAFWVPILIFLPRHFHRIWFSCETSLVLVMIFSSRIPFFYFPMHDQRILLSVQFGNLLPKTTVKQELRNIHSRGCQGKLEQPINDQLRWFGPSFLPLL